MKAKIIIEKLGSKRFAILIKHEAAEWACYYSTDQSSQEAAFKEIINVAMSIRFSLQALKANVEEKFYFTDVLYAAKYFGSGVKYLNEYIRE